MTENRPLVLVTGASSGIGLELARELAVRGYDLLVNAEDTELDAAARELAAIGVDVRWADLRTETGVEQLWAGAAAAGRPLEVAALNAGVGKGGPFLETDLADEIEIINLNVRSTMQLAKRVPRDMATRRAGREAEPGSARRGSDGGNQR